MTGRSIFRQEGRVEIDTTDAREVLPLKSVLAGAQGISFVLLRLEDAAGATLSQNVYWMSPGHDFADLRAMPSANVKAAVTGVEHRDGYSYWTIRFSNVSSGLAFFLNPQVIANGEEVLPSYWSDNYFSIPAGQSVTVRVSCPQAVLAGRAPQLRLEGWNVPTATIKL
jgi:hypothetical protein